MKLRIPALLTLAFLAVSMTGCGTMQAYHNNLQAKQNVFHRQQLLLDEQNQIQVNDFKSKQKAQLIQQARAEGDMLVARAKGEAAAEVERARGEAAANRLRAASLTPLLVRDHLIDALSDKTAVYLPSSVLLNAGGLDPGH